MRRRAAASAALAIAVLAASCVWRRGPDPTRFYVLPTSADSAQQAGGLAIGLGPIELPGYLHHSGLATRSGTQVRYAELDRWAEPLPTLFARALGHDVAALLGGTIVMYPWYRGIPVDVVVRVDVTSFEDDGAGRAALDGCWTVRETGGETVGHKHCASIVEPVDGAGAPAKVAALGRAVSELARRVASTIDSMSASRASRYRT